MKRTLPALTACALLAPFGLVYAHGDDHEEARTIRVQMGEMYFQVVGQDRDAPLALQAGEVVTLAFENQGAVEHEILLGQDVQQEDGQPDGYRVNFFDDVEVELEGHTEGGGEFMAEAAGLEEIYLDPDAAIEVTFTVPEERTGEWELGCFIAGHYQAGMALPVQVR